jgi:hypothetical protein
MEQFTGSPVELPPAHLRNDVSLWSLQNSNEARIAMGVRSVSLHLVVMIGERGLDRAIADPWREQDGDFVRAIIAPCGLLPADCMSAVGGFTESGVQWAREAHPWPLLENQLAVFAVRLSEQSEAGEP